MKTKRQVRNRYVELFHLVKDISNCLEIPEPNEIDLSGPQEHLLAQYIILYDYCSVLTLRLSPTTDEKIEKIAEINALLRRWREHLRRIKP
jgi:hypothetical protein